VTATHRMHQANDNNHQQRACRDSAPGQVKVVLLLSTPLLAKFPGRMRFLEHHVEQPITWLPRETLQFGSNPFSTSRPERFPRQAASGPLDAWVCIGTPRDIVAGQINIHAMVEGRHLPRPSSATSTSVAASWAAGCRSAGATISNVGVKKAPTAAARTPG
jgi:hypothetical protein